MEFTTNFASTMPTIGCSRIPSRSYSTSPSSMRTGILMPASATIAFTSAMGSELDTTAVQ